MRIFRLLPMALGTSCLIGVQVPTHCLAQDGLTQAQRMVNQANTLDDQGKYEDAIVLLKQAIGLEPRSAIAYYNLGYAYEKRKHDYLEAKTCYQKAVELNPRYEKAWDQLGCAYKVKAPESAS